MFLIVMLIILQIMHIAALYPREWMVMRENGTDLDAEEANRGPFVVIVVAGKLQ